MTLVTEAVIFAAQAHDGAARKGSVIPYIVHPMEVVAICATLTDDPQVLAAAALHDVMEDCGIGFDELSRRFGVRVAGLVCQESSSTAAILSRRGTGASSALFGASAPMPRDENHCAGG